MKYNKIHPTIFLLILILFLFSGCKKEKIVSGNPLSLEGLPVYTQNKSANYVSFQHLNEIQEYYTPSKTIVIRGVKEGLSTPIQEYDEDGQKTFSYCETKIRVLETFYGDITAGALITHKEHVEITEVNDEPYLSCFENTPPLSENEEYIFILSKHKKSASDGTALYGTYSLHHSYHKISDYQDFKQKVDNATATAREIFGYEVLDYYLNEPDTRLDLYREASQYVENLSETASQEEILAALPEEQRALFTRLIAQYGVKS